MQSKIRRGAFDAALTQEAMQRDLHALCLCRRKRRCTRDCRRKLRRNVERDGTGPVRRRIDVPQRRGRKQYGMRVLREIHAHEPVVIGSPRQCGPGNRCVSERRR